MQNPIGNQVPSPLFINEDDRREEEKGIKPPGTQDFFSLRKHKEKPECHADHGDPAWGLHFSEKNGDVFRSIRIVGENEAKGPQGETEDQGGAQPVE